MDSQKLPDVINQESSITPSTLKNFFSRKYLDTPLFHIRALFRNERIVLPDPPPSGLIDPQRDRSLVFFVKQREYASQVPMDKNKPPKNFTLSRESMKAALDTFRAGRSMSEATQEVAQASGSQQASIVRTEAVPKEIDKPVEDLRLARADATPSFRDAPEERFEVFPTERGLPRVRWRSSRLVRVSKKLVPRSHLSIRESLRRGLSPGQLMLFLTGRRPRLPARLLLRRPLTSELFLLMLLLRLLPPRSLGLLNSQAQPPLEKEKTPVVPLLSSPDNEILNAEDITHQSPVSVVAEVLRERMFGGVTEASDPHLLAVTSLLASSTREQVAFRSQTRGELGDIIREMLLMVMGLFMEVDARDQSLRDTVDRQIEEARHEENLITISDARGHLAATQEHLKILQGELSYTQDALRRVDERAATTEVRRDEVLEQLSSLEEARRERDEAVGQRDEV
ncbi:uncharacterized protein LOC122724979 [Manihot esculenta]|uniref:uncharacterized protein LOC122724979 n=1 Tax=Manihot esculenta TaxID=3983 RepID=UPI001CC3C698|nr:uncharacterized protein LOC122724979 [Manihot esculenta]